MASLAEVRDAIAGGTLADKSDELLSLARPCIELRTTRVAKEDLPLGASRIGGAPDLPPDVAWPLWKDQPQSFIAQFDLREVREMPAAQLLPPGGWLLFFYSARQDTWGFDPSDRESWTVVHAPDDAELRRVDPPATIPDGGVFAPCRVAMVESYSMPPWESKHIEGLALSDAEIDQYCDVLESVLPESGHQLLGHPDQIQGDMTLECQLVTNGLYTGDSTGWSDPKAEELFRGWADWQLLLQVASDDTAAMMWGDAGFLYYWIRKPDLATHDFDRSWMILQCH
jgi:uncharacterized protein YwqG